MIKKKKAKYLDQSRYPKIATKGYEENLKIFYTFTLELTVKELAKKIVLLKHKLEK